MLPPRPPSPPSGPPRGMNFSRRKLAAPSPPLPAWISMMASSTNFMFDQSSGKQKSPVARQGFSAGADSASGGNDAHRLVAARALLREGHASRDLREQRVVAPHADVGAGMHLGAALTHDDGTGAYHLAAVTLHAETLRLRVAAVT